MQVDVHGHAGKSLVLLIHGATHQQVIDAIWNGLKRPFQGKVSVIGIPKVVPRPDGTVLMRCDPSEGVADNEIVSEMRFQLTHHATARA